MYGPMRGTGCLNYIHAAAATKRNGAVCRYMRPVGISPRSKIHKKKRESRIRKADVVMG